MVLATTTTDLGVTTSVPEVTVMEKILQKLTSMHKAYSPGKKISILLKTCKLIYDSMALGNPETYCPSLCGCPKPSSKLTASSNLRPSPTWAWVSGTPL